MRHTFSLSPRDYHGQELHVGDICRRGHRGIPYRVISLNLDPIYGNWISTPDGPEQLIHSRVQVEDVCGIHQPSNVLAESLTIISTEVH